MILLGADFSIKVEPSKIYAGSMLSNMGRGCGVGTLLGNQSVRTECGLLAWLKWCAFKHCHKDVTTEVDG